MTSIEIEKFGISDSDLKRIGIHEKNILGAIPSLSQPNDPVCTWIIWEVDKNLAKLIQILKSGSLKQLKEFQEKIHGQAIEKYHTRRTLAFRGSNEKDADKKALNASREAARNIFKDKNDLLWFTKKSWTERIPIECGGKPGVQRREITEFLEKALQPNHLIMATRRNHSFLYLVISTGLILIYDTSFSHIFLVSLEGALQHFFGNESTGEKDNELFDNNDVYIAYQNFVNTHDDISAFSFLDSAILMSQLRKHSIILKIELTLTIKEEFIFIPDLI